MKRILEALKPNRSDGYFVSGVLCGEAFAASDKSFHVIPLIFGMGLFVAVKVYEAHKELKQWKGNQWQNLK